MPRKAKHGWRVVYGETMPAWEQKFPTRREARAFEKKQRQLGDIIFSVAPIIPGEKPKSMVGLIEAGQL